MSTIGIFGPIATFVQIINIFSTKAVASISPITWFGYTAVSLCWVFHGFFYKDKLIVVVNSFSAIASALVFVGYICLQSNYLATKKYKEKV